MWTILVHWAASDRRNRVPGVVVDEDGVGFGRAPRAAEIRQDRAAVIQGRLHDAPRALDDVLSGESAQRSVQCIADQSLVSVLSLAERSCKVDVDIDFIVASGHLCLRAHRFLAIGVIRIGGGRW